MCAWESVLRFAQRAWRRPMDTESRLELESFWSANLEGDSIEEAIGLTLAGILQSPAFLYHLEVGVQSSDERALRLTAFLSKRVAFLTSYGIRCLTRRSFERRIPANLAMHQV